LKAIPVLLVEDKTNARIQRAPQMKHKEAYEWNHSMERTNGWFFPIPQENASKCEHNHWKCTNSEGNNYGH